MLDEERKYFEKNQDELKEKHPGKYVLIKGARLVGAFDRQEEAMEEAAREFGLDNYLIRNANEAPAKVCIPALTLGILNANP